MIPIGEPEEAGVYELVGSPDRQFNYGEILLINTSDDPKYASMPAGYLEDIIPEQGKLLIRWVDGSQSEVLRSQCLLPLGSVSL